MVESGERGAAGLLDENCREAHSWFKACGCGLFPSSFIAVLGRKFLFLEYWAPVRGRTVKLHSSLTQEPWPAASWAGLRRVHETRAAATAWKPLLAVFILSDQLLKKVLTLWRRFHVDLRRLFTLGTDFSKSQKQSKENNIVKHLLFDSSVGHGLI